MNIGYILPGFSANESDTAIPVQHHLVRVLAQSADVRVLALRYPYRRTPYPFFGATVHPLGYSHRARRARRLLLWLDALRTLRRLHHQHPFDVLHATWADETGALAGWAGHLLGVPVVITAIGGEFVYFPDIDYGLQGSPFGRWTVRQAITGADVVLVSGHYQRDLLAKLPYRAQHSDITHSDIAPLGIDTTHFVPADRPSDRPHLIHAASLIPIKDQITLLRAMTHLAPDVTLDICGDGPLRPALEAAAQQLGVADRVQFLGAIPHDLMADQFRRAAIHVLPSRHEGQGMVTLEAAACGLPTVGTAVGLLPDHPSLGMSVPVGDATALATAIQHLIDHPDLRHELGQTAAATVRAHFSLDQTVDHLLTTYEELSRTNRRFALH